MKVKCVICEKVESLKDDSPQAKKLRNRRIHMYLCQACDDRIAKKTIKRQETGRFRFYDGKEQQDEFI
ncbi:YlaI family protein [Lentibacillus saliphilus]|uniref:YlaI family protein n=1 Tax=Lentibacillus saliphilus TaxID=2737028 RepID=UPI001C2FEBEE|nr:YlaI family protein [Lentibacillus saliphilus]